MRMEKPPCNFNNCKYHQDGNCATASHYENCKLTDLHSEIARLRVDLDNAKADTVRKMSERLTSFFSNDDELKYNEVDAEYINGRIVQIAKELLEGAK